MLGAIWNKREAKATMPELTVYETRLRALVYAVMSLLCFCLGGNALARTSTDCNATTITIDPAGMQKPWSGDLDGMIERRVIRVLTVNSKTFYFHDRGTLRGTVVEFYRLFEDEL
jgi:hypothetical protein